MNDLPARLRFLYVQNGTDYVQEAANEIERLTAERDALLVALAQREAQPVALPHPGSPDASAMMDSVLAEYGWPANAKNAARAGYEAARRLSASPQEAQPAERVYECADNDSPWLVCKPCAAVGRCAKQAQP